MTTTARRLTLDRSRALARRAEERIPGGAHTYAKGRDQYPEETPGVLVRGEGCHVWDADGNEYIEYGMGLRAVTLGHAFPPVVEAARAELGRGSNFSRPSPIEAECAEALLGVIEGAEMAKFTKDGSTATTAAVKLARAATGRTLVALCADQPFFSYDDWFIGTTEMDAGIPPAATEAVRTFRYNDLDGLRALLQAHRGEVACVMLEPEASQPPQPGYLAGVRTLCDEHGALLIFDENITGFRWHLGGGQAFHGVRPDLSAWGKAIANGFALSALTGSRELMELGGLRHEGERVFLLSTTHGAETHAMAAAIATIATYREQPVIERLHEAGARLLAGFEQAIARHGLDGCVQPAGRPWNLTFACLDGAGERSQAFRSLFLQENARRGVLGPSFVVSYAHTDADIDRTVEAIDGSLAIYARALADGVERHLVGPPSRPVFRRYN